MQATDDALPDGEPDTLAERICERHDRAVGRRVKSAPADAFGDWARRWMNEAGFSGPTCADVDERIARIVGLWAEEVPGSWQRPEDPRLHGERRYGRTHRAHGVPKPGSEHEIEFEILGHESRPIPRGSCFGGEIVDGVNAVPLARDAAGGRGGNVEADLLLLVRAEATYRQFLLEVKSGSNDAWYALVENLRQLRLFRESAEAQRIFHRRDPEKPLSLRVLTTSGVLAPPAFYTAPGKKRNATDYAQRLIGAMSQVVDDARLELCVWEQGAIAPLT